MAMLVQGGAYENTVYMQTTTKYKSHRSRLRKH